MARGAEPCETGQTQGWWVHICSCGPRAAGVFGWYLSAWHHPRQPVHETVQSWNLVQNNDGLVQFQRQNGALHHHGFTLRTCAFGEIVFLLRIRMQVAQPGTSDPKSRNSER